ncbi:MAG: hypothetical protein NT108_02945 [Candidatus Kaiserbacteria bacterium]|nr:hypothetical protein [Candidatus Kaiserbacteria bacterium]
MLSFFKEILTDTLGIRLEAWPLFILGILLLINAYIWMPDIVSSALAIALFLAPLWLPFLLVGGAKHLWYILQRGEFISAFTYVLLEVKPPRNLVKTPLAMEAFLSSLHLTGGESNWYARFWGGTRPFWSLEMASLEGQVHFFIWTRAKLRQIVETQIYAQYPGVQIVEAPDYSRIISATPEEWSIWGCDYKQTEKDPLPIKTYIEYGLDKVQKEPEQVDPLASIIEFMSSLGRGEYLWLQFVVRAHKGEKYNKLNGEGKPYTWKDEAKKLVDDIRKKTRETYTDMVTGEERPGFPNPTKGQSEMMAAIERNVSKLAFDVGGRCIYLAKPKSFSPTNISHMIALFKPFSSEGWNGINSTGWMKTFDDFPWEIGVTKRKDHFRRRLIEEYRRRQFFYDPFYEGSLSPEKIMVMSTEELATIYHIPSSSIESPGLVRVRSSTGQAPANLPM